MKKVMGNLLAACTLAIAIPALAQVKWFVKNSDEYKIRVCLNTGMQLKAGTEGKWGVLLAKEKDVKIAIMALKGTATFPEMQRLAVAATKIPGEYWKVVNQSATWNGFGQNVTYMAEGADRVAIAFLAKHGKYVDRNYVVFLAANKANFVANKAAFQAWGNCLAALP